MMWLKMHFNANLNIGRCYASGIEASYVFSSTNKANFIERIKNLKSIRPPKSGVNGDSIRQASVLVPFLYYNSEPCLLYTQRSPFLNVHRGEICFPGGKFDSRYDTNIVDAAVRETEEELGLDKTLFDVWTYLPPIANRDGKTAITPVIALLTEPFEPESLKLSDGEVEKVILYKISDLCRPENQGYTQFRAGYTLPVYSGFDSSQNVKFGKIHVIVTFYMSSNAYRH